MRVSRAKSATMRFGMARMASVPVWSRRAFEGSERRLFTAWGQSGESKAKARDHNLWLRSVVGRSSFAVRPKSVVPWGARIMQHGPQTTHVQFQIAGGTGCDGDDGSGRVPNVRCTGSIIRHVAGPMRALHSRPLPKKTTAAALIGLTI